MTNDVTHYAGPSGQSVPIARAVEDQMDGDPFGYGLYRHLVKWVAAADARERDCPEWVREDAAAHAVAAILSERYGEPEPFWIEGVRYALDPS